MAAPDRCAEATIVVTVGVLPDEGGEEVTALDPRESIRAVPVTSSSPVAPPTSRPPVSPAISPSRGLQHGQRSPSVSSAPAGPRPGQRIAQPEAVIERMDDTADLLSGLGALAGNEDGVGHVSEGSRRARSPRRAHPPRGPARSSSPGCPSSTARRISAGSSVRGLSSVTMTTSARRATTSPIAGRFVRSRSPPAPITTSRRRVPGRRAESSSACSRASGGVREVDDAADAASLRRAPSARGRCRPRPSTAVDLGAGRADGCEEQFGGERVGDVVATRQRGVQGAGPRRSVDGEGAAVVLGPDIAGTMVRPRSRAASSRSSPGSLASRARRRPHSSSTQTMPRRGVRGGEQRRASPRSRPPSCRGSRGGPG